MARDWTANNVGISNASDKFVELCAAVEALIRSDAHRLIAGRADQTARLIVAQLAHKHGLSPRSKLDALADIGDRLVQGCPACELRGEAHDHGGQAGA